MCIASQHLHCESSGQQSGHLPAGAADGRRPVAQGEDYLSSDKETQQQDSTYPNTWVGTADEREQACWQFRRWNLCPFIISLTDFTKAHILHLSDAVGWYYSLFCNIMVAQNNRHWKRTTHLKCNPSPALPGSCDIERVLRVDCGPRGISSEACYKLGCCYDALDFTCYYRLNGTIATSCMTRLCYQLSLPNINCVLTPPPPSLLFGWLLCVLGKGHGHRPAYWSQQPHGKGPASVFSCCQHLRHSYLQDRHHGLWCKNEGDPIEGLDLGGGGGVGQLVSIV